MKKIAILQSNYIPWKGYFDIIAAVDEFVVYDEVQFTKNDWRNRNKVKTSNGVQWISIPVGQDIHRRIFEVELHDTRWRRKHWQTLVSNYSRCPYFPEVAAWLEPIYLEGACTHLSELNLALIRAVCAYLRIATPITSSAQYVLQGGKTTRLVSLCEQAGARRYVSGPAARSYLDQAEFRASGIQVVWFDYTGYPEYPQRWGGFVHGVSILDLLFNCGPDSKNYMLCGQHDVTGARP